MRLVLIASERARHRNVIAMLSRASIPDHLSPSAQAQLKAEVAEEIAYRKSMLRMLTYAYNSQMNAVRRARHKLVSTN